METIIYSDEEFGKMVEELNSFNRNFKWRATQARKEHEDLFGDIINEHQIYFKREGLAYHDVIKLSRCSMELLLYAVFHNNFFLHTLSEEIIKLDMEENMKAINKLNILKHNQ